MKQITFEKVVETVKRLCIEAAHELSIDVLEALKSAEKKESNPQAAKILAQLIENAQIAQNEMIPLCQDTGLAVVFVEQGSGIEFTPPADKPNLTIIDAVNRGVLEGYEQGYLRKSVVAEPLNRRQNTNTNTPAIIHYSAAAGDNLTITLMAKGGGCENKSQFKIFKPTAEKEQIVNWIVDVVKNAGADACPPFVVGVGIGGNFELSCLLSKKALCRKLNEKNSDPFYADLEQEILNKINKTNLGPHGLGGDTTALGCLIEFAPCHIASLPVAVNIECHSHRHKTAVI